MKETSVLYLNIKLKTQIIKISHQIIAISPSVQNEIISTCGDRILKRLVKEVNESGYFSVLADETTDVSVVEQLTICVRHLGGTEKEMKIPESFLKLSEVISLTGENLFSAILNGN